MANRVSFTSDAFERRVVDAAAHYLGDEDGGIGFLYSGWAQAALPHKRLPDEQPWQVRTDRVNLVVEPGRKSLPSGGLQWVGVPYGSRARLIMLYLQTEALRTQSREIELGKSLRAWLKKMGISPGGKSISDVREQAERITRCRLTFEVQQAGKSALVQQLIVDKALFTDEDEVFAGNGSWSGPSCQRPSTSSFDAILCRSKKPPFDTLTDTRWPWTSTAGQHTASTHCPTSVSWRALHAQFTAASADWTTSAKLSKNSYITRRRCIPEPGLRCAQPGCCSPPSDPPIAPRKTVVAFPR